MTNNWKQDYTSLIQQGYSQREAAKTLGIPRTTIQDRLKMTRKEDADSTGPRILLYDLESAPSLAYVWGRWKQNVGGNQIEQEGGYLLTAAWKWLGESTIHSVLANDAVNGNDENVCSLLYEAIEQSDIIVAHNLNKFDYPMLNSRLVQNGFPPLKTVKKVDTLNIAKKNFRFNTNKLDDLGKYLGVGRKIDTGGFELWHKVVTGDLEALNKMLEYNKQDVLLLEKVYLKLRAFDSNPQANASHYYNDNLCRCPVCGSSNVLETGNAVFTPVSKFVEMQCSDCGHRSRKRQPINDIEKRRNILVTPK